MATEYPQLDADPTFYKVVQFFRPVDYLTTIGGSAISVASMAGWQKVENIKNYKKALFWGGLFGLFGGFLISYQNSTFRIWGLKENVREQELHKNWFHKQSILEPHLSSVAYRNTKNSQLLLSIFPVFNFVNHNRGVKGNDQ
eukprot:NODE_3_length_80033_cov_0.932970.p60 type:complete len:142 gc:universal NODE_3_length_80033_cov_0.932970:45768-45343(-)